MGFPKGASCPLVKGWVNTPPAKWLRLFKRRIDVGAYVPALRMGNHIGLPLQILAKLNHAPTPARVA
jgi:hypothetical protein